MLGETDCIVTIYVLRDINIFISKDHSYHPSMGGTGSGLDLYWMILTLISKAVCQPRSVGVLKPTKSNAVVAV